MGLVRNILRFLLGVKQTSVPSSNYYDDMIAQLDKEWGESTMLERESDSNINQEWADLRLLLFQARIDFNWLRDLYKAVIIPQVEKFGFVKKEEAMRSRYLNRIDLDHEQFSDSREIMRLGYVHLFHRFEAYRANLIAALDRAFGVHERDGIQKTMKKYYGVDLTGGMGNPKLREIAFIANSTKHTDGRPKGGSTYPPRFAEQDPKTKIKVYDFELLADMDAMEVIILDFFHTLATVHHRRRLDAIVNDPRTRTWSAHQRDMLRIEHESRTGQATVLVKRFFKEVPEAVRNTWPPNPDPWPHPELHKLFQS